MLSDKYDIFIKTNMNDDIKKILQELGLKEKEIDIYLSAMELGTGSAQEIAKRAGIKRTYFYDVSQQLIKRNLLFQTYRAKKKYYSAANPEKLFENEKNKIQKLEKAIPYLKSIYNTSGIKPKIRFYDGIEGLKEIDDNTLKHKGEILVFSTPKFIDRSVEKITRDYIKKRVEARVPVRVIIPVSNEALEMQKRDKEELRETRMIPQTLFSSDVRIGIYGNEIFIVNHKEKFGLIIESGDIAKPLKMIFELIWRSGFIVD